MGRALALIKSNGSFSDRDAISDLRKLRKGVELTLTYLKDLERREERELLPTKQGNHRSQPIGGQSSSSNSPPQTLARPQNVAPTSLHAVAPGASDPKSLHKRAIEGVEGAFEGDSKKERVLLESEVDCEPGWDENMPYDSNPLHKILELEIGSRGVDPVMKMKLFPVSGFQGSGSADVAWVTGLQFLWPDYQFKLLRGYSFEILPNAVEQYDQLGLKVPIQQMGSMARWPALAKRLKVTEQTIVCPFGGSPCDKIS